MQGTAPRTAKVFREMRLEQFAPLLQQGIAVVVLAWFMFRLEIILKEFSRQMQVNTRATLLLLTNTPGTPHRVKEQAEALIKESEKGTPIVG